MCYVIITGRSLAWLLLSLIAFMFILVGVMTPKWLLGQPKIINENNVTSFYVPSVGIYNRCIRMQHDPYNCASFSFYGLATDSTIYPGPWKAAMFFLSLCAAVQFATVVCGVLACCVHSVCRKSVTSLAGAAQALAGRCQGIHAACTSPRRSVRRAGPGAVPVGLGLRARAAPVRPAGGALPARGLLRRVGVVRVVHGRGAGVREQRAVQAGGQGGQQRQGPVPNGRGEQPHLPRVGALRRARESSASARTSQD